MSSSSPNPLSLYPTRAYPTQVLSLGMGVESCAILLRWILEPESRDFDLDDLVVVTSMVGDEFAVTSTDMRDVVLPAMRKERIRFVQVGRTQLNTTKAGDGVRVFSDTRHPTELYIEGAYRLSDELLAGGTVPQRGGSRRCSARAKGGPLDATIAKLTGHQPFSHYIGFHTGEMTRVRRDQEYNTQTRTGRYPLVSWGWSRQDATAWLLEKTGRTFEKSCCVYCPFSLSTNAGLSRTLERYRHEPDAGARALFIEHVSLCLNERQGLLGDRRLIDAVTAAGLHEVLNRFEEKIATVEHALYEVRRLARPRVAGAPLIARSVRRLRTGSRIDLTADLARMPGCAVIGADNITRMVVRERAQDAPWAEAFYVVGPAVVADKARAQFEQWWADITDTAPTLFAIT